MQISLNLKKLISLSLAGVLFCTQSLAAYKPEINFWANRKKNFIPPILKPHLGSPLSSLRAPLSSDFQKFLSAVPLTHGQIRQIHLSKKTASPPVLLIQDVHLNHEAQSNIAVILEELIQKDSVGNIGVEGAFDSFDFSSFHAFDNQTLRREVADEFLKANLIAAPSYIGITNEAQVPFVGIDDKEAYQSNVKAYTQSQQHKKRLEKTLSQHRQKLHNQKQEIYSPALWEVDRLVTSYRNQKIGLGPFLVQMSAYTTELDFTLEQFLEAYKLERSLDFNQVENQRKQVLEILMARLDEKALGQLLSESLAYKMGKLTFGRYYERLKNLCAQHKINLRDTPAFDNFIRYILLADGIDAGSLLTQVQELTGRVFESLAQTQEQNELVKQDQYLSLAGKLIEFSLTPNEWDQYQKLVRGSKYDGPELNTFENFYRFADIRSEHLVENLLLEKPAVMVIGGFHTPKISSLLIKKGVSFAVVSPKITKVDSTKGSSYLSVFDREKTPLDQLFKGQKLFINPDKTAVGSKNANALRATVVLLGVLAVRFLDLGLALKDATGVVARDVGSQLYHLFVSVPGKTINLIATHTTQVPVGFQKVFEIADVLFVQKRPKPVYAFHALKALAGTALITVVAVIPPIYNLWFLMLSLPLVYPIYRWGKGALVGLMAAKPHWFGIRPPQSTAESNTKQNQFSQAWLAPYFGATSWQYYRNSEMPPFQVAEVKKLGKLNVVSLKDTFTWDWGRFEQLKNRTLPMILSHELHHIRFIDTFLSWDLFAYLRMLLPSHRPDNTGHRHLKVWDIFTQPKWWLQNIIEVLFVIHRSVIWSLDDQSREIIETRDQQDIAYARNDSRFDNPFPSLDYELTMVLSENDTLTLNDVFRELFSEIQKATKRLNIRHAAHLSLSIDRPNKSIFISDLRQDPALPIQILERLAELFEQHFPEYSVSVDSDVEAKTIEAMNRFWGAPQEITKDDYKVGYKGFISGPRITKKNPYVEFDNQDSYGTLSFFDGNLEIDIVLDGDNGVGDPEGGATVVKKTKEAIQEYFVEIFSSVSNHNYLTKNFLRDVLAESLLYAREALLLDVFPNYQKAATSVTVTIVLQKENGDRDLIIGQAGDTRAYFLTQGGHLERLTIDNVKHSDLRTSSNENLMRERSQNNQLITTIDWDGNLWKGFETLLAEMDTLGSIETLEDLNEKLTLNIFHYHRQGALNAMTRHKPYEPVIFTRTLSDDEPGLLIHLTDGIFDVLTENRIEDIARTGGNPATIARKLVQAAEDIVTEYIQVARDFNDAFKLGWTRKLDDSFPLGQDQANDLENQFYQEIRAEELARWVESTHGVLEKNVGNPDITGEDLDLFQVTYEKSQRLLNTVHQPGFIRAKVDDKTALVRNLTGESQPVGSPKREASWYETAFIPLIQLPLLPGIPLILTPAWGPFWGLLLGSLFFVGLEILWDWSKKFWPKYQGRSPPQSISYIFALDRLMVRWIGALAISFIANLAFINVPLSSGDEFITHFLTFINAFFLGYLAHAAWNTLASRRYRLAPTEPQNEFAGLVQELETSNDKFGLLDELILILEKGDVGLDSIPQLLDQVIDLFSDANEAIKFSALQVFVAITHHPEARKKIAPSHIVGLRAHLIDDNPDVVENALEAVMYAWFSNRDEVIRNNSNQIFTNVIRNKPEILKGSHLKAFVLAVKRTEELQDAGDYGYAKYHQAEMDSQYFLNLLGELSNYPPFDEHQVQSVRSQFQNKAPLAKTNAAGIFYHFSQYPSHNHFIQYRDLITLIRIESQETTKSEPRLKNFITYTFKKFHSVTPLSSDTESHEMSERLEFLQDIINLLLKEITTAHKEKGEEKDAFIENLIRYLLLFVRQLEIKQGALLSWQFKAVIKTYINSVYDADDLDREIGVLNRMLSELDESLEQPIQAELTYRRGHGIFELSVNRDWEFDIPYKDPRPPDDAWPDDDKPDDNEHWWNGGNAPDIFGGIAFVSLWSDLRWSPFLVAMGVAALFGVLHSRIKSKKRKSPSFYTKDVPVFEAPGLPGFAIISFFFWEPLTAALIGGSIFTLIHFTIQVYEWSQGLNSDYHLDVPFVQFLGSTVISLFSLIPLILIPLSQSFLLITIVAILSGIFIGIYIHSVWNLFMPERYWLSTASPREREFDNLLRVIENSHQGEAPILEFEQVTRMISEQHNGLMGNLGVRIQGGHILAVIRQMAHPSENLRNAALRLYRTIVGHGDARLKINKHHIEEIGEMLLNHSDKDEDLKMGLSAAIYTLFGTTDDDVRTKARKTIENFIREWPHLISGRHVISFIRAVDQAERIGQLFDKTDRILELAEKDAIWLRKKMMRLPGERPTMSLRHMNYLAQFFPKNDGLPLTLSSLTSVVLFHHLVLKKGQPSAIDSRHVVNLMEAEWQFSFSDLKDFKKLLSRLLFDFSDRTPIDRDILEQNFELYGDETRTQLLREADRIGDILDAIFASLTKAKQDDNNSLIAHLIPYVDRFSEILELSRSDEVKKLFADVVYEFLMFKDKIRDLKVSINLLDDLLEKIDEQFPNAPIKRRVQYDPSSREIRFVEPINILPRDESGSSELVLPLWTTVIYLFNGRDWDKAVQYTSTKKFKRGIAPLLEIPFLPGLTLVFYPWLGFWPSVLMGTLIFALMHDSVSIVTEGYKSFKGEKARLGNVFVTFLVHLGATLGLTVFTIFLVFSPYGISSMGWTWAVLMDPIGSVNESLFILISFLLLATAGLHSMYNEIISKWNENYQLEMTHKPSFQNLFKMLETNENRGQTLHIIAMRMQIKGKESIPTAENLDQLISLADSLDKKVHQGLIRVFLVLIAKNKNQKYLQSQHINKLMQMAEQGDHNTRALVLHILIVLQVTAIDPMGLWVHTRKASTKANESIYEFLAAYPEVADPSHMHTLLHAANQGQQVEGNGQVTSILIRRLEGTVSALIQNQSFVNRMDEKTTLTLTPFLISPNPAPRILAASFFEKFIDHNGIPSYYHGEIFQQFVHYRYRQVMKEDDSMRKRFERILDQLVASLEIEKDKLDPLFRSWDALLNGYRHIQKSEKEKVQGYELYMDFLIAKLTGRPDSLLKQAFDDLLDHYKKGSLSKPLDPIRQHLAEVNYRLKEIQSELGVTNKYHLAFESDRWLLTFAQPDPPPASIKNFSLNFGIVPLLILPFSPALIGQRWALDINLLWILIPIGLGVGILLTLLFLLRRPKPTLSLDQLRSTIDELLQGLTSARRQQKPELYSRYASSLYKYVRQLSDEHADRLEEEFRNIIEHGEIGLDLRSGIPYILPSLVSINNLLDEIDQTLGTPIKKRMVLQKAPVGLRFIEPEPEPKPRLTIPMFAWLFGNKYTKHSSWVETVVFAVLPGLLLLGADTFWSGLALSLTVAAGSLLIFFFISHFIFPHPDWPVAFWDVFLLTALHTIAALVPLGFHMLAPQLKIFIPQEILFSIQGIVGVLVYWGLAQLHLNINYPPTRTEKTAFDYFLQLSGDRLFSRWMLLLYAAPFTLIAIILSHYNFTDNERKNTYLGLSLFIFIITFLIIREAQRDRPRMKSKNIMSRIITILAITISGNLVYLAYQPAWPVLIPLILAQWAFLSFMLQGILKDEGFYTRQNQPAAITDETHHVDFVPVGSRESSPTQSTETPTKPLPASIVIHQGEAFDQDESMADFWHFETVGDENPTNVIRIGVAEAADYVVAIRVLRGVLGDIRMEEIDYLDTQTSPQIQPIGEVLNFEGRAVNSIELSWERSALSDTIGNVILRINHKKTKEPDTYKARIPSNTKTVVEFKEDKSDSLSLPLWEAVFPAASQTKWFKNWVSPALELVFLPLLAIGLAPTLGFFPAILSTAVLFSSLHGLIIPERGPPHIELSAGSFIYRFVVSLFILSISIYFSPTLLHQMFTAYSIHAIHNNLVDLLKNSNRSQESVLAHQLISLHDKYPNQPREFYKEAFSLLGPLAEPVLTNKSKPFSKNKLIAELKKQMDSRPASPAGGFRRNEVLIDRLAVVLSASLSNSELQEFQKSISDLPNDGVMVTWVGSSQDVESGIRPRHGQKLVLSYDSSDASMRPLLQTRYADEIKSGQVLLQAGNHKTNLYQLMRQSKKLIQKTSDTQDVTFHYIHRSGGTYPAHFYNLTRRQWNSLRDEFRFYLLEATLLMELATDLLPDWQALRKSLISA